MGGSILIVDDSTSIRQVVTFTLKEAGYDVVEAADGREALDKLSGAPGIGMIVTDLHMPNVDGIELIRAVRAMDAYRFVPIVMLTTESKEARRQEGKAAGATGWIVKPFRPEQLVAVVRRVYG